MKRFMDCLFRGIVRFKNENINIILKTFSTGARNNKNFSIKVLQNGTDGNRLVLQTLNDEAVDKWIGQVDWGTGEVLLGYRLQAQGIVINANANPVAIKGGLYFNNNTNKWYKCEDGVNWIVANI